MLEPPDLFALKVCMISHVSLGSISSHQNTRGRGQVNRRLAFSPVARERTQSTRVPLKHSKGALGVGKNSEKPETPGAIQDL